MGSLHAEVRRVRAGDRRGLARGRSGGPRAAPSTPAPEAPPEPVPRPAPVTPAAPPPASVSGPPQPPPPVSAARRHAASPPHAAAGRREPARRRRPPMPQFVPPPPPRPRRLPDDVAPDQLAIFVAIAVNVVPGLFNGIKDATDLNIGIGRTRPSTSRTSTARPAGGQDAKPPVGLGAGLADPPRRVQGGARRPAGPRPRQADEPAARARAHRRPDAQARAPDAPRSSARRTGSGSSPPPGRASALLHDPVGRSSIPAAPQRLVQRRRRAHPQAGSKIDYLVASEFDGRIIWGAYFKGGQIVQGDARGKVTRRIS